MRNALILEYVEDITVAKLSNTSTAINDKAGQDVADFMQHVYDKLVELDKKEN